MVDIWTTGNVRYTTAMTLDMFKYVVDETPENKWMMISLVDGHYAYVKPKDILCFNSTSNE